MSALAAVAAEARPAAALARANARYWPTVLPPVQRGLRRWEARAGTIPDAGLRELALTKIAEERFNTEVAATLATLAPRRWRASAVEAIVALQVMYDYLDGLSELPSPDPLGDSRRMFAAFAAALDPAGVDSADRCDSAPHGDDGGYVAELVAACNAAFRSLPSAGVVAADARAAVQRCGESQTRTHAIEALGVGQLAEWAGAPAARAGLSWWEYVAGSVASILSAHALIAAAADPRTTVAEARRIDSAYLFVSAVSTLLDSSIDHSRDLEQGSHSFVDYYEDEPQTIERIAFVCARAASEGSRLRNGGHHRMTAVGVASYYLSDPAAGEPPWSSVKAGVVAELRPLIVPVLGIFRLWRLAKAASR